MKLSLLVRKIMHKIGNRLVAMSIDVTTGFTPRDFRWNDPQNEKEAEEFLCKRIISSAKNLGTDKIILLGGKILPGSMAVLAPVVIGFGLGPKALGGMLAGALVCCVMMALMMANAGGAWDNAKKYVEKGNLGGKGSDVHKAAVVGDTVGDPLKDTSGPAMNILINVMAIVSLVIAPLLV